MIHNPFDFSFDVATQAALGCTKPGHQTHDCWFNQAAFVVPALAPIPSLVCNAPTQCSARNFGNARRAALRGPDMVNFDFSAYKTFQLSERFGLVFRAEFFNLFNHPNFNLLNVGSGGGSSGAGFVNFSCGQVNPTTPSVCTRSGGGAQITQTLPDNQREIQFGAKLQF
jgi:hypothetical protein